MRVFKLIATSSDSNSNCCNEDGQDQVLLLLLRRSSRRNPISNNKPSLEITQQQQDDRGLHRHLHGEVMNGEGLSHFYKKSHIFKENLSMGKVAPVSKDDTNEKISSSIPLLILRRGGGVGSIKLDHHDKEKRILKMDGYLLSCLMLELTRSKNYRKLFIEHQNKSQSVSNQHHDHPSNYTIITIMLKKPTRGVLDILGNKIVTGFVLQRRDFEYALSWLSTLGGAFSALGDLSLNYAQEAGRVSIKQMKIAIKIDDPLIISRCRLFIAISLLQRGYLISAKLIVLYVYNFAKSYQETDPRLIKMCLGIWSKLKYQWSLNLLKKRMNKMQVLN